MQHLYAELVVDFVQFITSGENHAVVPAVCYQGYRLKKGITHKIISMRPVSQILMSQLKMIPLIHQNYLNLSTPLPKRMISQTEL